MLLQSNVFLLSSQLLQLLVHQCSLVNYFSILQFAITNTYLFAIYIWLFLPFLIIYIKIHCFSLSHTYFIFLLKRQSKQAIHWHSWWVFSSLFYKGNLLVPLNFCLSSSSCKYFCCHNPTYTQMLSLSVNSNPLLPLSGSLQASEIWRYFNSFSFPSLYTHSTGSCEIHLDFAFFPFRLTVIYCSLIEWIAHFAFPQAWSVP